MDLLACPHAFYLILLRDRTWGASRSYRYDRISQSMIPGAHPFRAQEPLVRPHGDLY